ncbi:hypothetical protein [Rhizobium mesoamericanum]|uniref:Uncharacterized protein n=1 Tax=Rhizobium mesoamericanum STM3625 TaxID=1211777 RepID=K0Q5I9_9HYPH|nr:hypothetical protein [Rhizobium mesoamericanum]CCM78569.1 conserved exported hypothetical protein [Rhizobium mesoamericanum STM3625]
MKKLALTIGIAALVAAGVGSAEAQQDRREFRRMNWSESLPEAVRTYHGKRLSIVSYRTASFSETGAHPSPGSAQHVEAIRAAARSNKWLVGQLKAKKLTPNDIEWVMRARNGSMVFYVK